jgi:hypothetical protein
MSDDSSTSDSGNAEQVRYPIPEGNQFYGRFTEADDAWMDAHGNIWLGDTQFTFDKDPADNISGQLDDPVDPYTRQPSPHNFQANQMRVGVYPANWEENAWIWFSAIDDALMAHGSNQKMQGSRKRLEGNFFLPGEIHIVWNNGVVSVGLFMVENPTGDPAWKMSMLAWFTYELDPQTGNPSYEQFEIGNSTMLDRPLALHLDAGLHTDFAKQVWDALAMLDTAASMADILAAQSAFN